MDEDEKTQKGPEAWHYADLRFERRYGDLILWKQIIKEIQARGNVQGLIFVTDDQKEDWWWIVESRGPKTIGPRPELVEELCAQGSVTLFYMYPSERFMHYARKYLEVEVKQESIEQVKNVAAGEARSLRRYLNVTHLKAAEAEEALYRWLCKRYPPSDVGYGGMGYGYKAPGVKMLTIARRRGGRGIAPTVPNALNGSYPITRPLFMYTNGKPAGIVRDYMEFVMSPEGQKIVDEMGFVPLSEK
jgi:hypothetical protein